MNPKLDKKNNYTYVWEGCRMRCGPKLLICCVQKTALLPQQKYKLKDFYVFLFYLLGLYYTEIVYLMYVLQSSCTKMAVCVNE